MSFISSYSQSKYAKISGKLDIEVQSVPLAYDGVESMLGNSKNIDITADSNGFFSISLRLDKPAYYKIKNNTLYISPGDDLHVVIEKRPENSQFNGRGAEANNYLKKKLFPKSGSFLRASRLVSLFSLDSLKHYVKVESDKRLQELRQLNGVSHQFKSIEIARIKADIANTYMSYPAYHLLYLKSSGIDYETESKKLLAPVRKDIINLMTEINKDLYMNAEVVRVVLKDAYFEPEYKNDIAFTESMKELFETQRITSELFNNLSVENINKVKSYMVNMKNPHYKSEIVNKINSLGKLLKGANASDIVLEDTIGKLHKLSDFKGKYIYIDIWATWCGPCNHESPFFEKLSKEVRSDDLVYIGISIDSERKPWKNYLKGEAKTTNQYLCSDKKLWSQWMLKGIPRFIIIDKDFKIVDASASRPSDPKTKEILNKLVSHK